MNYLRTALLRASLLPAVAGLALLGANAAFAGTSTQSFTQPQRTTDYTLPFTFAQFDPSLGTLDSVTLTLDGGSAFSGTIKNVAASAEDFEFTEGVNLELTGPAGADILGNASSSQSYTGLAAGGTAAFGPVAPTFTAISQVLSPAAAGFSSFVGTGTVPFNLGTLTSETIRGGGGNQRATLTTTAGGHATLTYNYTNYTPAAVPEASTTVSFGLLLALGLGVLVVARKKKTA
jgi:hypothetical protein